MPGDVKNSAIMLSAVQKAREEVKKQPEEKLTIETVKLTECTSKIFKSMEDKGIARFGDGWIVKCKSCGKLLEVGGNHKTFVTKNKKLLRIAPSIICDKETGGCGWNVAITIKPEVDLTNTDKSLEEETDEEAVEEETDDGVTIE